MRKEIFALLCLVCVMVMQMLIHFQARSQNCEMRLLALQYLPVRLQVRVSTCSYQPLSVGIFMKFDILSIFRNSVEKIQVSLQYDKNYGYFTRRPIYDFDHIPRTSSQNEKYFRQKSKKESKHTLLFSKFFTPKIVPFVR